uniref:Secreted protein n=1 Tax=Setaria viridis TaxID=4556 RepID=A0A4U6UN09_SETVI|nr:hypothetical protein SEVIR_5G292466v2 [Setaria viridis]
MMLHIVVFFVSSLLLSLLQCCKRYFFLQCVCFEYCTKQFGMFHARKGVAILGVASVDF